MCIKNIHNLIKKISPGFIFEAFLCSGFTKWLTWKART